MDVIMRGDATAAQVGALLVALRLKGETVDEIAGCAEAMRDHAVVVRPSRTDLVDTAGTGGDGLNTFNISTAAALVAAAAGAAVAKHGNRAVSSASGSADVLEALGLEVELEPQEVARSIDELGFGFMFAPAYHPAMRHASPVRRELGARTIFNVLGPLTNPAGARAQIVGVYAEDLVPTIAGVLLELGAQRAFVVHGTDGIDELSPAGSNVVCEVVDGTVRRRDVDPADLGVPRCSTDDLRGGSPAMNARAIREVFSGRRRRSAQRHRAERRRRDCRGGSGRGPPRRARAGPRRARERGRGGAARAARRVLTRGPSRVVARFRDALAHSGLGAIAEVKRRSPSAGSLRPDADPARLAATFERNGAAAVSILVDERFGGSFDDLVAARAGARLPLLAKGFFSTDAHLESARLAGADAALLLLRDLDDARAAELMATAARLGLDALVEAHDAEELERAVRLGADPIGINARDLATFRIDRAAQLRLVEQAPRDRIIVAESGIESRAQGAAAELAGAGAVLVGSTLMRASDPGASARRAPAPSAREGVRAHAAGGRRTGGGRGRGPRGLHPRRRDAAARSGGAAGAGDDALGGRARRRGGRDGRGSRPALCAGERTPQP